MTTIDDVVRALGPHARLVVPPPHGTGAVSAVLPWEPHRTYAADTVLLGAGVPGEALLEQVCAGVVLREPADPATRAAWSATARRHGTALILLAEPASWPSLVHEPAPLPVPTLGEATGEVPRGDLFALADAFADLVGGPTIIEDANFRVLSYSSFTGVVDQGRDRAILGRRMPPEWLAFLEDSGDLERLRTGTDVVDLTDGPWQAHRRLITAVRDAGQLLGVLWAAEGDRPLAPDAPTTLRRAAEIAVPHLLRHQEGHRAERLRRGTLVRSVLDGRGLLHRHATELGFPPQATFAVMALAPVADDVLTDDVWDRITDHVALSCEAFRWHAAVARVGNMVFALLALPDEPHDEGALRLGREIVSRSVPVLRGALCGAISTAGARLGMVHQYRREAEDAVTVLRAGLRADRRDSPRADRFVAYDAVRQEVILHELRAILAQREDLRLPGLHRLAEEDRQRQSEFVPTLRAFLRCGGQSAPTARHLGIHVTTLRYRLGRIRALSGLDLDDASVRLTCQLLIDVQ